MERIAAKLRVAIFSALAGRDDVRARGGRGQGVASRRTHRPAFRLLMLRTVRHCPGGQGPITEQNPLAGLPPSDLAVGLSDAASLVAQEILQAGTWAGPRPASPSRCASTRFVCTPVAARVAVVGAAGAPQSLNASLQFIQKRDRLLRVLKSVHSAGGLAQVK